VIRKAAQSSVPTRIPASDFDAAVSDRVLDLLRSPNELLSMFADVDSQDRYGQYAQLLDQSAAIAATWPECPTAEQGRILNGILERVLIYPRTIEIKLRANALLEAVSAKATLNSIASGDTRLINQHLISLVCPFQHISQGKTLRLIVGNNRALSSTSRAR
jgi:hypothetical protein